MFKITYHSKIVDDLSHISSPLKKGIRKAIEEKLTSSPEFFGKPLRASLKGYRTMRVGDHRIVFALRQKEVHVIITAHKSTIYKNTEKRI